MSPVRLRLGLALVCVHSPKTKGEVTVIVKPALLACISKFLSFSHFSRFLSSRRRDDGDDGDNDAMIDTILFLFTESTCFLTSQHAHRFFGTCDAALTYIFFPLSTLFLHGSSSNKNRHDHLLEPHRKTQYNYFFSRRRRHCHPQKTHLHLFTNKTKHKKK